MSSISPSRHRIAALHHLLLQAALLLLIACAEPESAERQVRAVIDGMQAAVEARDASDFMQFIGADFSNPEGLSSDDVQRALRGYLLANPSIKLFCRVRKIEFPLPEEARVEVEVGRADEGLALVGNRRKFELVLRRQQDEWRVIYGQWNRQQN